MQGWCGTFVDGLDKQGQKHVWKRATSDDACERCGAPEPGASGGGGGGARSFRSGDTARGGTGGGPRRARESIHFLLWMVQLRFACTCSVTDAARSIH